MRRADRLFQIVSYMQGRRVAITAQDIADEFDISVRTVYRDIQDLITTGIPIRGEAGIGYIIDNSYSLPPMTLDIGELETLMLGASMVNSWTDKTMAKSAKSLIQKISNVLSDHDRAAFAGTALFVPRSRMLIPWDVDFTMLRKSIRNKTKLSLEYEDETGTPSTRIIRPLSMSFWGASWLLHGWCELRDDHRHFRLDRIQSATLTGEIFEDTPKTSLKAYMKKLGYKDMLFK